MRNNFTIMIQKVMPLILMVFLYSYWSLLGYDVKQRTSLFVALSIVLSVVAITTLFQIYGMQKMLKKDSLKQDEYMKNKKLIIINSLLFILTLLALALLSIFEEKIFEIGTKYLVELGRGDYRDIWNCVVFFKCSVMMIMIRCFLGALLFKESIISFSQNLIRAGAIVIGVMLSFTWYSFISLTPILNAVVLSMTFDTILNKGIDIYVLNEL